MTSSGLIAVSNPSQMFLQERPVDVAGSVVTACMEGTRPVLVEIQALVSSTKYGTGRRMTQGVDQGRVALLIAMLEKRAGFQLLGDDVFVNIAGGLEVDGGGDIRGTQSHPVCNPNRSANVGFG